MPRELSIGVRGFRGRESGRRLTPLHQKKSGTAGLGGVIAALSLRSVALWTTLSPFYNRLELRV